MRLPKVSIWLNRAEFSLLKLRSDFANGLSLRRCSWQSHQQAIRKLVVGLVGISFGGDYFYCASFVERIDEIRGVIFPFEPAKRFYSGVPIVSLQPDARLGMIWFCQQRSDEGPMNVGLRHRLHDLPCQASELRQCLVLRRCRTVCVRADELAAKVNVV